MINSPEGTLNVEKSRSDLIWKFDTLLRQYGEDINEKTRGARFMVPATVVSLWNSRPEEGFFHQGCAILGSAGIELRSTTQDRPVRTMVVSMSPQDYPTVAFQYIVNFGLNELFFYEGPSEFIDSMVGQIQREAYQQKRVVLPEEWGYFYRFLETAQPYHASQPRQNSTFSAQGGWRRWVRILLPH